MTENSTNFTDIIDGFLFLSFTNLSEMNKVYEQKLKDACQRREASFAAFRPNNVERKIRRKKIDKFKTPPTSSPSSSKDPAANCEQNNTGGESRQQQTPHNIDNCTVEENMVKDSLDRQTINREIGNGCSNDSLSNDNNDENRYDDSNASFTKSLNDLARSSRNIQSVSNLEAAKQHHHLHHHHNLNVEENRLEQRREQAEHDRNPSTSSANFCRVAASQKMIINQQMEKEGASDENSRLENPQINAQTVNDDVVNYGKFASKPKFKREIAANNSISDEMNKRRKLDVHCDNSTDNCNTIANNNNNILAPNISDKIVSTSVINFLGENCRSESLDKISLQKKPIAVLPAGTISPSHSMGSLTNGRPNFLLANRNAEHQLSNDNNVRLISPKKELLSGRTPPSTSSQSSDSLQRRTPASRIASGGGVVRPPSITVETPKITKSGINNASSSNLAPFFLQQSIVAPPPPSLQTFQPSTAAAAVAAHFPTFLSPLAAASLHSGSMLSFANNMPRLPLIPIDTQVVANNPALFSHPVVPNIIPIKKKGKWCALHVQIAWDIHNKMKQKRDKTNSNNCQSQQQPSTSSSCSSITESHPSLPNSRDASSLKNDLVNHNICQSNPKIPVQQNSNIGGGQRIGEMAKSHHHHHHHHHHKESSSQQASHSIKNKEKEKSSNQEISRPKRSSPAVNGYSDQRKLPSSLIVDHSARSSVVGANKTTPPDPQMTTNQAPPPPPVPAPPPQTAAANHPHQQDMSMLNAALNNFRAAAADMGNFLAAGGPAAINFVGQQRAPPPDAYSQAAATFALFQSQMGAASNPHLMQASPMPFASPEMMRIRPPFLTPSTALSIGALGPTTASFDPHAAALANLYANLLPQRQYGAATVAGLSSLPPGHNAYAQSLLSGASSSSSTQDLLSRLFMAYHQQQQPLPPPLPTGGGILDPATRQALAAQLAFLNGFSASPLGNGGGVIRPPQLSALNQSPSASSSSLTMQESPLFNGAPGGLFGGGGLNFLAANAALEMSNSAAAHNGNSNSGLTAKCLPSPFSATLQHMATHRNDLLMPGGGGGGHQSSVNMPMSNPAPNHNLHNG